jgi:hypothetical protein
MVLGGLLILRRMHPELHRMAPPPPAGTKRKILVAIAPIGLILVVWFVGDLVLKTAMGPSSRWAAMLAPEARTFLGKFGPLILGLITSLVYTLLSKPLPFRQMMHLMVGKELAPLLGLVLSVMIYQQMLLKVHAAEAISTELAALHVPVVTVVILLPFIAGMLTGIAFGFVGVSFPLVLSLVASMAGHPAMRPYAVLAYASGHLGMMLSPIHLCYVVSNRYFSTTFGATLRLIAWPSVVVALLAAAYFLLLRWAM